MTDKYPVLFLTDRGRRHQRAALMSAPPVLDVTMLRRPPKAELLRRLPETEFLISERSGEIDADVISTGENLRLIQRLGSMTYDIDLEAARRAGVLVSAWPVRACVMVAEHMVLQMLALAKRLAEATSVVHRAGAGHQPSRRTDEDTFAYNWSGRENIGAIYERTVGILGFGEIGAELARRLHSFVPARILYHKRRRLPELAEEELGLTYVSQDRLAAKSDFLCNLLPYSAQTDMLIDAEWMARTKPGAFLVSCGSGSVIDETALAEALRAGRLAGAALDTFEWEPIRPDNPLLPLARDPAMNLVLTPHTAAGSWPRTAGGRTRLEDYVNIMRILRGEPVRYRVT